KALSTLDCKPKGHRVYDQFLFHPEDVPFDNWQQIPKVFTEFRKKCEKQSEVRNTVDIEGYKQEMPKVTFTPIPSLADLGLEEFKKHPNSAFPFEGGEIAAWDRLDHYFWDTEKLKYYKKTRNGLLGTDYSSKFSPWLALG
ncbi:deoxyribodipyrimidine photolyase, partial [Pseudomonas fluorescens]